MNIVNERLKETTLKALLRFQLAERAGLFVPQNQASADLKLRLLNRALGYLKAYRETVREEYKNEGAYARLLDISADWIAKTEATRDFLKGFRFYARLEEKINGGK